MSKYQDLTKEELLKKLWELENELKNKKYWLVWDAEKFPEQVVLECENNLPVLEDVKLKEIKNPPAFGIPLNKGDLNWDYNILIEWDNYHALTVLNYTHEAKIDVIYIDPPYNTGNKDFIYNDKFIEKEDKFRHSKWLNFMEKRLKLAQKLLKDDWVIFISIDDNEQAQLKLLCDKIFWEENFVWKWMWFRSATPPNLSHKIKKNFEYIIWYEKVKNNKKYVWVKKESKSTDPFTKPQNTLKILKFPPNTIIFNNFTKWLIKNWIYWTSKFPNKLLNDLIIENWYNKNEVSFENKFVWLQEKLNEELINNTKVFCSKDLVLSYKKENYSNEVPPNIIDFSVWVETTEQAWNNLIEIFWEKLFDYPKPVSLISYLINFINKKDSTILDFFAWSWTTWHAVLDLNKEDWWNRKFILCTNNENNICEEITYKRLEKVINWYNKKWDWEFVEWLGWNLKYFKTSLVKKTRSRSQLKINITKKCTEMLCLKENIFDLDLEKENYKIFSSNNKDRFLAVYYNFIKEDFNEFLEELKKLKSEIIVYIFSVDNTFDKSLFKWLNVRIEAIPQKILEVYKALMKV